MIPGWSVRRRGGFKSAVYPHILRYSLLYHAFDDFIASSGIFGLAVSRKIIENVVYCQPVALIIGESYGV